MCKKIIMCMAMVAIVTVNFIKGTNTPVESEDLMLENIETVGLSASETTCSGTGDPCEIYSGGMLVGKGHGTLTHIN